MPRPRIAIPLDRIIESYERTGSLRSASLELGICRWTIVKRFQEAGIIILDRDEIRRRRSVVVEERAVRTRMRSRVVGGRGETIVTTIQQEFYDPCAWPDCEARRREGALCRAHARRAISRPGRECAWPTCTSAPGLGDTALCYMHTKVASGEISRRP